MLKTAVLSFFLFVLLGGPLAPFCFSQDWQSPDSDVSPLHLPDKFLSDLSHLFTPDNDIILASGVVLTATDWIVFDPSDQLPVPLHNLNIQPVWDFGDFYGLGWVEATSAIGGWIGGAFVQDLRLQEFGRDATESLVLATVTVTGLKYAVGRERPDGSNNQSFPSGHTITAFCFAPVVSRYWGEGWGIAAYTLGGVTALARVEGYHHYLSDTFAGATLGIVIGNMVVYHPKDISLGLGPGTAELKVAFN